MPATLSRRACAIAITASYLITSVWARTIWTPEVFDPSAHKTLDLLRRDVATCPGSPKLYACSANLPPNFCCASDTTCMQIETNNAAITAAICCPNGSECKVIAPVSCNEALQDANSNPNSQLHVIPPQKLDPCGTRCCPMGYTCDTNKNCVAQGALLAGPKSTSSRTSTASATSTSAPDQNPPPVSSTTDGSSDATFNGKSFAAGLIPGIALGVIVAALVIFCCIVKRKRQDTDRHSDSYGEKSPNTLTDLGTMRSGSTMHGRSISEPTVNPSMAAVTRTDFLRSSPARTMATNDIINNRAYQADSAPQAPASCTPKIKALFSRSPFMGNAAPPSTPPMMQQPLPAHLKRGTLTYQVSPIRALKKQKSMHSLRRQMTESRKDSTETIQVLMSPDDDPAYKRQSTNPLSATSRGGRQVPYASSSRYPSLQPTQPFRLPSPPPPIPQHQTPSGFGAPSFLDSPYTPTKSQGRGLAVPADPDSRRETTFSTLMEKAGIRRSDLVVDTNKKVGRRYGY